MADFIPVHVTTDGSDTDGLREYSTSDDIAVTNDLRFKDNNQPYLYLSNENGNDKSYIRSRREWNSAWQNVLEFYTLTSNNGEGKAIKMYGQGDIEFGTSGAGSVKVWNVLQLGRISTAVTQGQNSLIDYLGGAIYFTADNNKITYYDGTSNQIVASEAYVAANAGGGGGVTPEILMFL